MAYARHVKFVVIIASICPPMSMNITIITRPWIHTWLFNILKICQLHVPGTFILLFKDKNCL